MSNNQINQDHQSQPEAEEATFDATESESTPEQDTHDVKPEPVSSLSDEERENLRLQNLLLQQEVDSGETRLNREKSSATRIIRYGLAGMVAFGLGAFIASTGSMHADLKAGVEATENAAPIPGDLLTPGGSSGSPIPTREASPRDLLTPGGSSGSPIPTKETSPREAPVSSNGHGSEGGTLHGTGEALVYVPLDIASAGHLCSGIETQPASDLTFTVTNVEGVVAYPDSISYDEYVQNLDAWTLSATVDCSYVSQFGDETTFTHTDVSVEEVLSAVASHLSEVGF